MTVLSAVGGFIRIGTLKTRHFNRAQDGTYVTRGSSFLLIQVSDGSEAGDTESFDPAINQRGQARYSVLQRV